MSTDQDLIHVLENNGSHEEAAKILIEKRFFSVNRTVGLLARLPAGKTGREALCEAAAGSLACTLPKNMLEKKNVELSAGIHYLVHWAPAEDRVYVQRLTLDAYRQLGGGDYRGASAVFPTPRYGVTGACQICGEEWFWGGLGLCESCHQVTTRFPTFLSKGGRDYIFRWLGTKFGIHEMAEMLKGAKDAGDKVGAAKHNRQAEGTE